jgi:hypothetical protein
MLAVRRALDEELKKTTETKEMEAKMKRDLVGMRAPAPGTRVIGGEVSVSGVAYKYAVAFAEPLSLEPSESCFDRGSVIVLSSATGAAAQDMPLGAVSPTTRSAVLEDAWVKLQRELFGPELVVVAGKVEARWICSTLVDRTTAPAVSDNYLGIYAVVAVEKSETAEVRADDVFYALTNESSPDPCRTFNSGIYTRVRRPGERVYLMNVEGMGPTLMMSAAALLDREAVAADSYRRTPAELKTSGRHRGELMTGPREGESSEEEEEESSGEGEKSESEEEEEEEEEEVKEESESGEEEEEAEEKKKTKLVWTVEKRGVCIAYRCLTPHGQLALLIPVDYLCKCVKRDEEVTCKCFKRVGCPLIRYRPTAGGSILLCVRLPDVAPSLAEIAEAVGTPELAKSIKDTMERFAAHVKREAKRELLALT